jgi:hypothetical protein
MAYPNVSFWSALKNGDRVPVSDGRSYDLSIIDCGFLVMPTGRLVACDPFAAMRPADNPSVQIPPGRYRVIVTLADVSDAKDLSHVREAYATLVLDEAANEVTRRIITPYSDGSSCPPEMTEDGTYSGFPVDAGTACFVDDGAISTSMPADDWLDGLFDNGTPESWFARMDDPNHIRAGIANIPLPNAKNGENIVIVHSGWGDGHFPVIGGYDASNRLVRAHIDFFVVFPDDP